MSDACGANPSPSDACGANPSPSDRHDSGGSRTDHRLTRRSFVVVGGLAAMVGAGGAGLVAVAGRGVRVAGTPSPPEALVAAVAAEQARVTALDAALAATPAPASLRELLTGIRANHAAHERALRSLLPIAEPGTPTRSPPGTPASTAPPERTALRGAESAAATLAAERAERLTGGAAALLASISACEATHAELLS